MNEGLQMFRGRFYINSIESYAKRPITILISAIFFGIIFAEAIFFLPDDDNYQLDNFP